MQKTLAQKAVGFALTGNWKDAKNVNLQILKNTPDDIDALNRLAKALFELGKLNQAKNIIKRVIKIDPYNPIAIKSTDKWKNIKNSNKVLSKQMSPDLFLEEPGKTKIVHLVHTCDKSIIASLNCGDLVYENAKSHRISVVNESGEYIGKISDDISIKLRRLIRLGYKYVLAIKSIDKNEIKVFIRETFRPEKYMNIPSFSAEKIDYMPYTPPEMVHDKPTMTTLEEETENAQGSDFPDSDVTTENSGY